MFLDLQKDSHKIKFVQCCDMKTRSALLSTSIILVVALFFVATQVIDPGTVMLKNKNHVLRASNQKIAMKKNESNTNAVFCQRQNRIETLEQAPMSPDLILLGPSKSGTSSFGLRLENFIDVEYFGIESGLGGESELRIHFSSNFCGNMIDPKKHENFGESIILPQNM